jgi:hypothetical protein
MDIAGENLLLKQRIESKDFGLPIKVEFTPHDTPQMNSPAEVAFATLGGRARAMMTGANVPFAHRKSLMPEACKHAKMLDGLVVIKLGDATATRYEHQFGKIPPFAKHLHTWGEAGVVTLKARHMHPKHASRGVTCLYVGHSPDHPSDMFRMVDMATGRVHITRDVTWLHRMFFPKSKAGEGTSIVDEDHNAFPLVNPEEEREETTPTEEQDQQEDTEVTEQLDHHNETNMETDDDETMITDNRSGEPIFTRT